MRSYFKRTINKNHDIYVITMKIGEKFFMKGLTTNIYFMFTKIYR